MPRSFRLSEAPPPADPAHRRLPAARWHDRAANAWLGAADPLSPPRTALPRLSTRAGLTFSHDIPLRPQALPDAPPTGPLPPWSAPDDPGFAPSRVVVVAVIDDAINIAHQRFRTSSGSTRVDYAWIMDGTYQQGANPLPYGREWTRAEIDSLTAAHGAEEGEILAALELADFRQIDTTAAAKRHTHGTHVADLAAGGADASRRLITVQLPRSVILEASGATLPLAVEDALFYIRARAANIAATLGTDISLIVNFSFSLGAGPHNGQHLIEQSLAGLVSQAGSDGLARIETVLPAGNRHRLPAHAARSTIPASFHWMVPGGDASPNFLEIWLPGSAGNITVALTLPDGQAFTQAMAAPGTFILEEEAPPHFPIAQLSCDEDDAQSAGAGTGAGKQRILLATAPSFIRDHGAPAPPGIWQITISADLAAGQKIEAWVQRDEHLYGYRRQGAPAVLVDQAWSRDAALDRALTEYREPAMGASGLDWFGALSAIATNSAETVVSAKRWKLEQRRGVSYPMAEYSSAASAAMPAPAISAVSDRSRLHRGIPAAGTRSGSVVYMNGTSVACPQVARALADAAAAGGNTALFRAGAGAPGTDPAVRREDVETLPLTPELEEDFARAGLRHGGALTSPPANS